MTTPDDTTDTDDTADPGNTSAAAPSSTTCCTCSPPARRSRSPSSLSDSTVRVAAAKAGNKRGARVIMKNAQAA